jgi:murein L,D-transpeptidase YcbB/YkuD
MGTDSTPPSNNAVGKLDEKRKIQQSVVYNVYINRHWLKDGRIFTKPIAPKNRQEYQYLYETE